jgi:hypothetical protein
MLAADDGESSVQATGSRAGHAFSRPGRWASRYPQPSASPGRTSARASPGSWRPARSTTSVHLSDGPPKETDGRAERRLLALRLEVRAITQRYEESRSRTGCGEGSGRSGRCGQWTPTDRCPWPAGLLVPAQCRGRGPERQPSDRRCAQPSQAVIASRLARPIRGDGKGWPELAQARPSAGDRVCGALVARITMIR